MFRLGEDVRAQEIIEFARAHTPLGQAAKRTEPRPIRTISASENLVGQRVKDRFQILPDKRIAMELQLVGRDLGPDAVIDLYMKDSM